MSLFFTIAYSTNELMKNIHLFNFGRERKTYIDPKDISFLALCINNSQNQV